jgi:hypothetical protein
MSIERVGRRTQICCVAATIAGLIWSIGGAKGATP